jgi:hypothetical protein
MYLVKGVFMRPEPITDIAVDAGLLRDEATFFRDRLKNTLYIKMKLKPT